MVLIQPYEKGLEVKKFICFVGLLLLMGCAAPKYSGTSIESKHQEEIVIIHDEKTREIFQESMEDWLIEHKYKYVVVPEDSKHDLQKLTLEYVGYWGWDLSMYLKQAYIKAFHEGQRVAKVEFKAPDSLNPNKWGDESKRIGYMMDVLFGEISPTEANQNINK
jgi:hypothetical protein